MQNLLSSSLFSKNVNTMIYRTIILPLSLTLREECTQRVSENRVLRILGPKKDEVTGEWRTLCTGELQICTLHLILFRSLE